MKKLGLSFFPAFDWAISATHPEREERLLYTRDQLFEEGIDDLDYIKIIKPKIIREEDVKRVHFILPNLLSHSHLVAAGSAYEVYRSFQDKEIEKGFALVRPPGHHAHKVVYGDRGFCIINVGAVAIEKIRANYGPLKIAIVDSDAHHGDGTEDIYYNDKNTLLISIHQDGRTLYPGSGSIENFGGPSAYGYNINIPLPPETGESGFLFVMKEIVMPILSEFQPDIIINSAGQDNHYSDPLTNMNFTAQGYAKLNSILNPDLAILEGGYSVETALPYINLGIVLAMAGEDYSQVIEPDFQDYKTAQSEDVTEYIKRLSDIIMDNWKNKDKLALKKFGNKSEIIEKKRIYYDTSQILENQTRTYHLCHCGGYEKFSSISDSDVSIKGIYLPQLACKKCHAEALNLYQKSVADFVFFQDRVNDKVFEK